MYKLTHEQVFLRKIQIYKSTGSYEAAKAMYVDGYTKMTPEMLKLRPIILEKKKVCGVCYMYFFLLCMLECNVRGMDCSASSSCYTNTTRQERPLFVQPHLVKEGDVVRASRPTRILQSNQLPQPTYIYTMSQYNRCASRSSRPPWRASCSPSPRATRRWTRQVVGGLSNQPQPHPTTIDVADSFIP